MTTETAIGGAAATAPALPASVLIVGSGLLGTSLGLALRRRGVRVHLADTDPVALAAAQDVGGGTAAPPGSRVDLAVVAVPPASTGPVLLDLLDREVAEVVTDVASVKVLPHRLVAEHARAPERYVGGHPMAGREVSGPHAAVADLFEGRPWALCVDARTPAVALDRVRAVVLATGATPVRMDPSEHDAAVALVSHTPHLVASLVAGRLAGASDRQVGLAGPGVGDITRVAAGDPRLWTDILSANAAAVAGVLRDLRTDLDAVLAALELPTPGESALRQVLERGSHGRSRLPGKHGAPAVRMVAVLVVVDDRPGQLARLFADAGESGVNVEDVRIEHRLGQPTGVVELDVRADGETLLAGTLRERGWTVHDA